VGLKALNGTAVAARLPDRSDRSGSAQNPVPKTSAITGILLQKRGLTSSGDAPSMRQDQWKSQVLQEWDRWLQAQPIDPTEPTARDTLKFFCELQDRRSPLLDFRPGRRDKWQIIHAWLHHAGRVAE
jgi:hypothetical protein